MSTTSTAASVGIIGGADGPTAIFVTGAEGELDIDSIKGLLDGFDPATLLPDLSKVFDSLAPLCRIAVMIGPLVLLALGLSYLFLTPKEANYYVGYRCYFGMGSEYAWRFTQRLAGILFAGVGLVLSVVMYAISISFSYMQLPDMVWKAASCLVVELAASVLLILIVNFSAMYHFDRKGKHRRKKRR
jgi:hypothetical protein